MNQVAASASIGQVHRAKLNDGAEVAVKVQRPNIRAVFERDNLLLRLGVRIIFFFRIRSFYFMRDPVRELSTWTTDELDYRREAAYAKLLGANAAQTPTEKVPKIYWDLCSERILTMEFLEGPSVASYLRMLGESRRPDAQPRRSAGNRASSRRYSARTSFPIFSATRSGSGCFTPICIQPISSSFRTTWWATWTSAS